MHLDVTRLRDFYYTNALGRAAQVAMRRSVARRWPDAERQAVLGFGFAVPLLRPFLDHAKRVTALMPGPQGVMPWPAGLPNVSVLCGETSWPIETGHVDRLILLHGLETSEQPMAVLDEAYRVLGPGGRLLVIVPNRAGLWSRSDQTPFGFGRPYSQGQLDTQLGIAGFRPVHHDGALWRPPSMRRFWRRSGAAWERMGARLHFVMASGVLIVEAVKQIPRPSGLVTSEHMRILPSLEGLVPDAKPVGRQL